MAFGKVLAVLFFLALSFAALSSLISMIELASRALVDFGLPRPRAVATVAGVGFVLGVPSALDLDVFANQDFVWGVALMISGAFVAFAVIRYGAARLRDDLATPSDWTLHPVWDRVIRYLIPLEAIVLLVWWLGLAATVYAPDTWYNPFEPFSVMTCLVQWGVAMLVLGMLNNRLATRSLRNVSVFE